MPELLEEGVIYVSIPFALVSHRCCCGCGEEVVLKLSPLDWRLTFDGATISLSPSIGNWSLKCRSHYFITQNRVHWAPAWSEERVAANRQFDRLQKGLELSSSSTMASIRVRPGFLDRLKRMIRR